MITRREFIVGAAAGSSFFPALAAKPYLRAPRRDGASFRRQAGGMPLPGDGVFRFGWRRNYIRRDASERVGPQRQGDFHPLENARLRKPNILCPCLE